MARHSPWSRFVDSAVQGQGAPAAPPAPVATATGIQAGGLKAAGLKVRRLGERVGAKLRGQEPANSPTDAPRRRTDVRLALPAFLVWGAAIAGVWLIPVALVGLCCGLVLLAAFLLTRAARGRGLVAGRRSFLLTTAVALVLAATAAAHSAVSSSQRHDGALAEAVAAGNSVIAILEVTGSPRAMTLPGSAGPPERWSVTAQTDEVTVSGRVIRTRAAVVVMGGKGWGGLVPGQI
nr:ComEC/Rec2 family competence protein [Actinomycetota bacterium]